MLEKQHQSVAFELIKCSKLEDKQILYFCESDKEARLLKNELLLLLDDSSIGYYPEREILPYDRFSTTDSIIQDRLKLLNSDKKNLKIVVTSSINLFEKLPSKNNFLAKKQFRLGDSLSIKDLTAILEDLNYQRVDKVTAINEYTVRGGVVDLYSGFHKQPLRVDFFGDQIDEIRIFDPSSQHMIDKLSKFGSERYNIVKKFTTEAAFLYPKEYFDFIYLDASHTYESSRRDIQMWWPKLKQGGIFAGDDYIIGNYEPAGYRFGVKDAVDEFASIYNLRVNEIWKHRGEIGRCPLPQFYIYKC